MCAVKSHGQILLILTFRLHLPDSFSWAHQTSKLALICKTPTFQGRILEARILIFIRVSWVLSDYLGAYHPIKPIIKLGFRHPRKKTRKKFQRVSLNSLGRVFLLRAFLRFLFLTNKWWAVGGFRRPWNCSTQEILPSYPARKKEERKHHSGPSPMRPIEHWTCPDKRATRAKAPGRQQGSCGSVWRGRGGGW